MVSAASDQSAEQTARDAVERLIDRLAASPLASALAIAVVALICFLPGLTGLPPLDRDEAQIAEAARQMVAAGDPGTIRFVVEPQGMSPVGMVWLTAATGWLAGGDPPIWVYRIPSLIGAAAAAILTWWMALAFGRPRAALLAGLFMAANLILASEARIARPDAIVLAALVVAQGALARLWLTADDRRHVGLCAVFWAALGVGILLKGPVVPTIVAATLLVLLLDGRDARLLRRLQPVWGVPLAVLIAAPWLVAVLTGNGEGEVTAGNAPAGLAGSIAPLVPTGTYSLLFFALLWPAAAFFALAIPWLFDRRGRPVVLFATAWGLPVWIVAEFVSFKLPHLVLPAFPAIALLAGTAIDATAVQVAGRVRWLLSLMLPLLAVGVAVAAPAVVYVLDGTVPYTVLPPLIIAAALGVVAWRWLRIGSAGAAAGVSVVASAFICLAVFALILPGLDRTRLSGRVLEAAKAVACKAPRYAVTGFVEPSFSFLTEGDVRFVTAAGAAEYLDRGSCRIAVVENRQLSSFRQRAEDIGIDLDAVGRVQGFNPGNGRWVNLRLFVLAASKPEVTSHDAGSKTGRTGGHQAGTDRRP